MISLVVFIFFLAETERQRVGLSLLDWLQMLAVEKDRLMLPIDSESIRLKFEVLQKRVWKTETDD